jgi:L-seryl-tRNA(Ser) seleniumtransferase
MDIESHSKKVMKNVKTLVETGGGTMDSILQLTVFLTTIDNYDGLNNALLNDCPFENTLGRGQKVGKEEIVGMIEALEIYWNEDHEALTKECWSRLDKISADVTKLSGVSTAYFVPDIANHVPHVQINWDPRRIALAPREAAGILRKGAPSIVVEITETRLAMDSFMLQREKDAIVGSKIAELLRAHLA